jgi:cyclophilin family peptidyl-prolyl cis-trans isomerase
VVRGTSLAYDGVARPLSLVLWVLALALVACGDDDSDPRSGSNGDAGADRAAGEKPASDGARSTQYLGPPVPVPVGSPSLDHEAGNDPYTVRDVPPRDAAYTERVVAMAETGAEPPGSSGSQFYIVTASDAGLSPDYALLGEVTKGIDVVMAIGELGDAASGEAGTPLRPVVIEGMTVRES